MKVVRCVNVAVICGTVAVASVFPASASVGMLENGMGSGKGVLGGEKFSVPKTVPERAKVRKSGKNVVVEIPPTLTISGASGQSSILIPVPFGKTPVRLTGVIEADYNYRGKIVLTAKNRVVAEVDARKGGRVDAKISGKDLVGSELRLGMYVALVSEEQCLKDNNSQASFGRGRVVLSTSTTPVDTVAHFLSDGVRQYTVTVPQDPTGEESAAGLNAVTALSWKYPQNTKVVLEATDDPPRSTYLNRTVRFEETASPGNTVEVTSDNVLLVSGAALSQAAVGLGNSSTNVLGQRKVADLGGVAETVDVSGPETFTTLGLPAVVLSGIGKQTQQISVNQSMFGHSVKQISLSLKGASSSLPLRDRARVNYEWNGKLVGSVSLGRKKTVVNQSFVFTEEQVERNNVLSVVLEYYPKGSDCSPLGSGARFEINPDVSTVAGAKGDAGSPGFAQFPQSLSSTIPVGFGGAEPVGMALRQAGFILQSWQAGNPQQYVVDLMSVEEFAKDKRAGLFVGGTLDDASRMGAPVVGSGERLSIEPPPSFTAVLSSPAAILQAYRKNNRHVVFLGRNSSPSDSFSARGNTLMTVLAEKVNVSWSGLPGQAVFVGDNEKLLYLDVAQLPDKPDYGTIFMWSSIIASLFLLLGVVGAFTRPRKKIPEKIWEETS